MSRIYKIQNLKNRVDFFSHLISCLCEQAMSGCQLLRDGISPSKKKSKLFKKLGTSHETEDRIRWALHMTHLFGITSNTLCFFLQGMKREHAPGGHAEHDDRYREKSLQNPREGVPVLPESPLILCTRRVVVVDHLRQLLLRDGLILVDICDFHLRRLLCGARNRVTQLSNLKRSTERTRKEKQAAAKPDAGQTLNHRLEEHKKGGRKQRSDPSPPSRGGRTPSEGDEGSSHRRKNELR